MPAPALLHELGAPTLAAIEAAAERIRSHAVRTPLLESPAINALTGARVLFKAEVLQQAASFKFRGACNRLLQLTPAQRAAGVVAWSSGNHALAISAVARLLDMRATILMPSDAPSTKIDGARRNGATVRLYDRLHESRETLGAEIAARTGATIVPPYDDPYIMTGQATVGLEIVQQSQALGRVPDAVLAACSGGGLVAGVAAAVRALSPATAVYAVEPQGFDELARSLQSGQRERNAPGAVSMCDALQVAIPGELTFPVTAPCCRAAWWSPTTKWPQPCAWPTPSSSWWSNRAVPSVWPRCWPAASMCAEKPWPSCSAAAMSTPIPMPASCSPRPEDPPRPP